MHLDWLIKRELLKLRMTAEYSRGFPRCATSMGTISRQFPLLYEFDRGVGRSYLGRVAERNDEKLSRVSGNVIWCKHRSVSKKVHRISSN